MNNFSCSPVKLFSAIYFFLNLVFITNDVFAACTNDADVTVNCSNWIIDNSNQTLSVSSGITVSATNSIGLWIKPTSTDISLTNFGTIQSNEETIFNQGSITSFINNGTVSGGYHFFNAATIDTLTNLGSFTGVFRGIYNTGTIVTLNNLQGGTSPLILTDSILPQNYNVIINSPSSYGKLSAARSTGPMTFGIYSGSTVATGTYAAVLSNVSSLSLSNTSGTYGGLNWSLSNSSGAVWDLIFAPQGPSALDTQSSLLNSVISLRSAYAMQNAALSNMLEIDCSVFDARGVCISAGGRWMTSSGSLAERSAAVISGAFRLNGRMRIGMTLDQDTGGKVSSNLNLDGRHPMASLFGVWSQRTDGTGGDIKLSAGWGSSFANVTRTIVGSSEAGTGGSALDTVGLRFTARFTSVWKSGLLTRPYLGIRHTHSRMSPYAEATSSSVTAPLTYGELKTSATTVLAGLETMMPVSSRLTLSAGAGLERDIGGYGGRYDASGLTGLHAIDFTIDPISIRANAALGAHLALDKHQQLSLTSRYRQGAWQGSHATAVYLTYSVGI